MNNFEIPADILAQIKKNKAEKDKNLAGIIETKFELVNWLGQKLNFKSYLEISTYNTGSFFHKVKPQIFEVKECFNYLNEQLLLNPPNKNTLNNDHDFELIEYELGFQKLKQKGLKFDVVFVDSYHTLSQTIKDINVALELVSEKGIIVVHDCNPPKIEYVGNEYREHKWCGQTYEGFIKFRVLNPQIESYVVDIDLGCGIILPNRKPTNPLILSDEMTIDDLCLWENFDKNRKYLLNLINLKEFERLLLE